MSRWIANLQIYYNYCSRSYDISIKPIQYVLQSGANPNATFGEDGTTALHEAASRGANDRILDLLIQHGANLKTLDQHGQTPLDLARTKQKERVVNFLQKAGKS